MFVIACTIGLTIPIELEHEQLDLHSWKRLFMFLAAKALHITIYLTLTYLSGWLRVPSRCLPRNGAISGCWTRPCR